MSENTRGPQDVRTEYDRKTHEYKFAMLDLYVAYERQVEELVTACLAGNEDDIAEAKHRVILSLSETMRAARQLSDAYFDSLTDDELFGSGDDECE